MAQDVGPDEVKDTAIALGIPQDTPDLTASPSIALGPATASVLDMASAYATLADHGKQRPHTLVAKITKNGSDASSSPPGTPARAVSREAADTTTSVLRSVVDGGTGTAAQGAGRPAAGKTGTAEEDRAAWFAGYTPDLATVIAVMGQDPETGVQKPLYGALGLARMNGGGAPAETWAAYTRAALEGSEVQDFDLEADEGPEEPDPDESGEGEDTEEAGGTKAPRDGGSTKKPGTGDARERRDGDRTRAPEAPSEASPAAGALHTATPADAPSRAAPPPPPPTRPPAIRRAAGGTATPGPRRPDGRPGHHRHEGVRGRPGPPRPHPPLNTRPYGTRTPGRTALGRPGRGGRGADGSDTARPDWPKLCRWPDPCPPTRPPEAHTPHRGGPSGGRALAKGPPCASENRGVIPPAV